MIGTKYKTIKITLNEEELDYSLARRISEEHAAEIINGPMLIAWYNGITKEEHPAIPECQHKPSWLAYADGHGACLRVDVNEDVYSFIYTESGLEG